MNAVLSAPPETFPAATASTEMEAALAPIHEVIRQRLTPQVAKIDTEALYPHDVMRALGQAGAYLAGCGNTQQPSPRPSGVMRYQRSTSTT